MPRKDMFDRSGTVGDIKEIRGTSMELNTQKMLGGEKPKFSGKESPGGTKPERCSEASVPLANGR